MAHVPRRAGPSTGPRPYTLVVPATKFLDLNAEIDRLYQLPLGDFVRERNALAGRVKAEQGAEAAAHIKTLGKPGVTAWIVNQLYWRHRTEFMALLVAGDAFRLVQQQRLGGAEVDIAPATRARQSALDVLLGQGADLLKEAGHQPTPDMRQRLQTSLEALASYGTADAAPRHGRLTAEVSPPTFAALAAMLPPVDLPAPLTASKAAPKLTVVARRDRLKLEAERARAEAALSEARTRAAEATKAQAAAEERWQAARRALADAQRRVDDATTREQAAQAERDERRRDVARSALAMRDAERALDVAARALKD
jgi:hypothetical protein